MKLLLKIITGIIIFIVILLVGLNLYFSDERLKSMILPEAREMVGTEVQAEHISLTFFKTFPRVGVELNEFLLPDQQGDTLATLNELLVGVELFPLMRNEISISELILNEPVINYVVHEDSSSNIDFLLELGEESEESEDEGYSIAIPNFSIQSALINYRDYTSNTFVFMRDLDADISLSYADQIESSIEAELRSLSATIEDESYVENLSLSLSQTSTLDMKNEVVEIEEATFSIRGLALNVDGTISSWSEDVMLDLNFASSSENFGELLQLVPPEYDEYLTDLESRGSLLLEGSVAGTYTEENLPDFNLVLRVNDGYLKNPDLPDAIEDIQIQLSANNELITITEIQATAAENSISASGSIEEPLEEHASYSVNLHGDIDLATISRFYPIEEFDIEEMGGILATNLNANGPVDNPEGVTFSGNFSLSNGMLRYAEVPQPIEGINANLQASQDLITIRSMELSAADNSFSMTGTVTNPLSEDNRAVDLNADLDFELASIKEFYPIDEDTLQLRGHLTANMSLQGQVDPDQIEQVIQSGTLQLQDGYIAHEEVGKPLEDVTLSVEASGTTLRIHDGRFTTGSNELSMDGTINNYLSDDRTFDLSVQGLAALNDVSAYYSLDPWIQELFGEARLHLNVAGPPGDPQQMQLNGSLVLNDVQASGDSLPLPVRNLRGELSVSPQALTLSEFFMNFGETDISLEGEVENYLGFLEENPGTNEMPEITGRYQSNLLNLDEMIDWEDDSEEPVLIELPEMRSNISAVINRLKVLGLEVTDISGTGRISSDQIVLEDAEATFFEGTATGSFVWQVPQPDRTQITFNGGLENVTAEAFFRDTGFLGEESTIHQYLTGTFSSNVSYSSQLDEFLSPDISTIEADGTFGMSRARLAGHPIQQQIAEFLNANELSTLALDEWNSAFTINDQILTFSDLNITSENIGLELDGTLNLETDQVDYRATVSLPARFKKGISSVLPEQAVEALQRDDGIIAVPVRITGTSENPRVGPDEDVIQEIVEDYLKDRGGDLLDRIFGRDN